jgi:hypothetical protein
VTAVPRRALLAPALLLALLLAVFGCNKDRHPAFERECGAVQKVWSGEAEIMKTSDPRQNGNGIQASWEYKFARSKEAAMKSFASRVRIWPERSAH